MTDIFMKELSYIYEKYNLDLTQKSPIEIPNVGRDTLGILFRELGYKRGVELGVERGHFSKVLCTGNPDMTLFGVDAWKAYSGYREHVSQEKLDRFQEETKQRMAGYNFIPLVSTSMEAVSHFPDRSLDFVYIDANHTFPYITQDIYHWSKKVRIGGMVAGHDYKKIKRLKTINHVFYVVNAYMQSYRKTPWFLLGSKNVIPGEVRDHSRSWFFIQDGVQ